MGYGPRMKIDGPVGTKPKRKRSSFYEDHSGNGQSQSQTHSFGQLSSGSSGRSDYQLRFQYDSL